MSDVSDLIHYDTYYETPILKPPVWIWTVPAYFYVGGVAGAAIRRELRWHM